MAGFTRNPQLEPNSKSMKETKLTLFVAVLAAALFGVGCASTEPAFVASDGLVAYYPFNGNPMDATGNGHNGELKGASLTIDRHGEPNRSFKFDGIDDLIEIAHQESLNIPDGGLTLSAWMNTENRTGQIITKGNGGRDNYDWHIQLFKDGGLDYAWRTKPSEHRGVIVAAGSYKQNKWQQIVVSHQSGSIVNVYVDGVVVHESTDDKGRATWGDNIRIGASGHGGFFKGEIDDVRIYNRALSTEEVKALYDLEKPKVR